MKQMSLSQVCKKFKFTRRVIQGYEKEGLIKHTSKNKYGHLMYDDEQIKKITYIRYLQLNGLTLKEIVISVNEGLKSLMSSTILEINNIKLLEKINMINELIDKNNEILSICSSNDYKNIEEKVLEIMMEEILNEKNI